MQCVSLLYAATSTTLQCTCSLSIGKLLIALASLNVAYPGLHAQRAGGAYLPAQRVDCLRGTGSDGRRVQSLRQLWAVVRELD